MASATPCASIKIKSSWGEGKAGLTSLEDRRKALEIPDAGMAASARACKLAELLGVGLTTLQRWRHQFAGDGALGSPYRKPSPGGSSLNDGFVEFKANAIQDRPVIECLLKGTSNNQRFEEALRT